MGMYVAPGRSSKPKMWVWDRPSRRGEGNKEKALPLPGPPDPPRTGIDVEPSA